MGLWWCPRTGKNLGRSLVNKSNHLPIVISKYVALESYIWLRLVWLPGRGQACRGQGTWGQQVAQVREQVAMSLPLTATSSRSI